jgi:hypothetical protein
MESAEEETEDIAEYLTVPKEKAVMFARVFPFTDTLISMGVLVTSTEMSPDVQPKVSAEILNTHPIPSFKIFLIYSLIIAGTPPILENNVTNDVRV